MSPSGHASFKSTTWEETPYAEIEGGRKLTRVHAVFAEGTVDYLMAYGADGLGIFVGLERIVGSVNGKSGSFAAQHTGTFDLKAVHTHWVFVPGLGTEGLEGITGSGELKLEGHGPYPFTFDYHFKDGG
jgi:Protein of unknown function (DUF3224)